MRHTSLCNHPAPLQLSVSLVALNEDMSCSADEEVCEIEQNPKIFQFLKAYHKGCLSAIKNNPADKKNNIKALPSGATPEVLDLLSDDDGDHTAHGCWMSQCGHELVYDKHCLWYARKKMFRCDRQMNQLEIVMTFMEFYNNLVNTQQFHDNGVMLHNMT